MSQHATELCTTIVRDVFGELGARIFSILCTYGRLPLHSIQLYTNLRIGQVKYGLALLTQQHVVSWYPQHDGITYYEANITNARAYLQFGQQLELVENRVGPSAAAIVSEVHLSGRCRVQDLLVACTARPRNEDLDTTPVNGTSHRNPTHGQTGESFAKDLVRLIESQILKIYHESHSRSDDDNWRVAEQIARERHELFGQLKAQDKIKIDDSTKLILQDWRQGTPESRAHVIQRISASQGANNTRKRRLAADNDESEERSKRRQLNNGAQHANGVSSGHDILSEFDLSDDIVLVNYEKLRVIGRNEILVSHAEKAICPSTASVYAKVLGKLERTVTSLPLRSRESRDDDDDEEREELVTTQEVLAALGNAAYLADSIAPADATSLNRDQFSRPRKRTKMKLRDDEAEVSGEDVSVTDQSDQDAADETDVDMAEADVQQDTPQIELVRQHLFLLTEHPLRFLNHYRRTASTPESWSVRFGGLTARLRLLSIMDTIASRYPPAALRLANLLHEKGKLDEKALSAQSLLNQKIMRSCLASLHNDGLLELQEVPRDNNRMPAKTIFLWFFDTRRAAARLVNESYKAMCRLLQRVDVERELFGAVLDKANRSDVVGREEELLTKSELSSLKKWKAKESRLFGELERLDNLATILQDG